MLLLLLLLLVVVLVLLLLFTTQRWPRKQSTSKRKDGGGSVGQGKRKGGSGKPTRCWVAECCTPVLCRLRPSWISCTCGFYYAVCWMARLGPACGFVRLFFWGVIHLWILCQGTGSLLRSCDDCAHWTMFRVSVCAQLIGPIESL